jgi:hypothetical protein
MREPFDVLAEGIVFDNKWADRDLAITERGS